MTARTADTAARTERTPSRLIEFFAPAVPVARVAYFRIFVYVFVIIDVLFFASDVFTHADIPEFYSPLVIAQLLHLPPVTTPLAWTLFVVLMAACVAGILGIFQRLSGWLVCVTFWIWMLYSQGYGYVSHDHLALMIAVLVLPTVGTAQLADLRTCRRSGWALRCVQIAVVCTYVLSVLMKWLASVSLARWANGSVFVWAIMRRGAEWTKPLLEAPWLLIIAQWGLLICEVATISALFVRERILYFIVAFWLFFHLMTYLALGISFLPTVVCWAAFLPLERWLPSLGRRLGVLSSPRAD